MSQDKASKQAKKVEVNIMTITTEMRTIIKDSYKVLRNAYQLKGTVFCREFDKARTIADCKMERMIDTLRQSSYDLWRLGLLAKEQYEEMNNVADKLDDFVSLAVQHFNNLEKNKDEVAYFGRDYDYIKETTSYNDAEIVSLFGTRKEYIEARIENDFDFDCLDDDLKAVLQYFNLIK
jgi:hypothetical protein